MENEKQGSQHGSLDNIRFLRSDLEYKLRLKLLLTDPARPSRLELPSGTYRFSVYVKQDTAAGSGNAFPASRISLGINRVYDSGTAAFTDDNSQGIAAASAWSSDWTEVSATFTSVQVNSPAVATYPVLELTISATDSSSDFYRDVGSILISSPSLVFISD